MKQSKKYLEFVLQNFTHTHTLITLTHSLTHFTGICCIEGENGGKVL